MWLTMMKYNKLMYTLMTDIASIIIDATSDVALQKR